MLSLSENYCADIILLSQFFSSVNIYFFDIANHCSILADLSYCSSGKWNMEFHVHTVLMDSISGTNVYD